MLLVFPAVILYQVIAKQPFRQLFMVEAEFRNRLIL